MGQDKMSQMTSEEWGDAVAQGELIMISVKALKNEKNLQRSVFWRCLTIASSKN